MRVAIFDFDGTLYRKETFQLLMDHLKAHPNYSKNYGRFFRAILPRFLAYKLKLYPEARMKERSMQIYINALKDVPKDDIHTYFSEVAELMVHDFNEDVVERLNTHQQNNDYIMLVSGAFTPMLKSVAKSFSIDQIIGTEIPFKQNKLDQTKQIYHIQSERKTEKILHTLKDKQVDWDHSYAYGDSYSDLPVLQLVGHPIAVQPDDALREKAEHKGWEII